MKKNVDFIIHYKSDIDDESAKEIEEYLKKFNNVLIVFDHSESIEINSLKNTDDKS